jgi:hypothetical protein
MLKEPAGRSRLERSPGVPNATPIAIVAGTLCGRFAVGTPGRRDVPRPSPDLLRQGGRGRGGTGNE